MSEPTAVGGVANVPRMKQLKTINSARVKGSYIISGAFSLFSAVLLLVCMQMPQWFIGTTGSRTDALGVGYICQDGRCGTLTYSDMKVGSCTIQGSSLDQRVLAIRWTLYFAIATALLSVPCYLAATFRSGRYVVPSLLFQILSLSCATVCIVLFAATVQSWLFCGSSYCTLMLSLSASNCYTIWGTGYVMAACATCCLLVGCIFAIAAIIVQKRRESTFELVMASRNAQYQAPTDFEAPEGFFFDPSCGLYYSDEAQLYLDPVSCHYYDPSSGLWYDTAADVWYEIQDDAHHS